MNDSTPPLPPALPPQVQASALGESADASHLKTLAICHYVLAGLSFMGMFFILFHYFVMSSVIANEALWRGSNHGAVSQFLQQSEHLFKYLYLLMGVSFLISALGNLLSGIYIRKRKNLAFSLVMAACNCMKFPLGTVLGVFTFIVLLRDSVMRLYDEQGVQRR